MSKLKKQKQVRKPQTAATANPGAKKSRAKRLKPIPRFETEDEEREFWATAETGDYFDMSKAVWMGPLTNLKPSTTTISLRLPTKLLEGLRSLADERDVPYQSLLKVYLTDRVSEELQHRYRAGKKGSGATQRWVKSG